QTMTPNAAGYTNFAQQTSTTSTPVTLLTGHQLLSSPSAQHFSASFGKGMYWAGGVTLFRAAGRQPLPSPSPTPTPTPTSTPTPTPTPTPTSTPTPTPSPSPS